MSGSPSSHPFARGALIALLGSAALSCASDSSTPQQAQRVVRTSFLGDYSELERGASGQALLRYVEPTADFSRYDKIVMDPVVIWAKETSDLAELPIDEVQSLVDYADGSLRDRLGRDYAFVDRPGPGVMRLRVAITEAEGAPAVMGTVSGTGPGARLITGARKLATGTSVFVERAGAEVEILDSLTQQRLVAAIDRQLVQTQAESWDDIHRILDLWSDRLAQRLGELRSSGPAAR
jgi:hypothetical protein